jgi:glutamate formiminotransferase / 5-formyltetrahydrofolate cyclo-ligase
MTMSGIFECVPNVSEGRRADTIKAIGDAAVAGDDVVLLDTQSDSAHNRSVYTLVGSGEGVLAAAIRLAGEALKHVDLRSHQGEHPRMGAVDVIPFVPVSGATMDDAVALARRCAQELWQRYQLPSYYYEFAATRPERRDLSALRKGQFEGLLEGVKKPARHPDVGDAVLHPSAGIVAVGARNFLIAFNVNLASGDLSLAERIAVGVRRRSGGLLGIKALGFALSPSVVQVSMNVVDVNAIPLYRVTELIRREAAAVGVAVRDCELVGLAPLSAIAESAAYYLHLGNIEARSVTW